MAATGISNITRYQGYQSGNGQVIISWNVPLCVSSSRVSITVPVNPIPYPALTASPSVLCSTGSSALTGTSAGNYIGWWDAASGGNLLAYTISGGTYPVIDTTTTLYYSSAIEANPFCVSLRNSITVTVSTPPAAPSSANATPSTIYCGDSTVLNAVNSGGIIRWWSAPAGGTMLGTSASGC